MGEEAPLRDRFAGCLLGGALGDALGYAIEFDSLDEIVRRHGNGLPDRLAFASPPPALVSDDTQMTMFGAEGLLRAQQRGRRRGIADPVLMISQAYLRWLRTQEREAAVDDEGWLASLSALYARRAPGMTCLSALQTLREGASLPTVERPPNDSKGCGAVMRVAPIGMASADHEAAFDIARDSAVITHGHPSGYLSAAYLGAVLCDLLRGRALDEAMTRADRLLAREAGAGEMQAVLEKTRLAAEKGVPSAETIEELGGGWVGEEALAIGLLCAMTMESSSPLGVKRALWRAARHSGDSDSTAAIAGNLLGAALGESALPVEWLRELELAPELRHLSDALFDAFVLGGEIDALRFPPH